MCLRLIASLRRQRVHVDLLAGFRPQVCIRPTIVHAENTNA
jgi:hypothetical protein